MFKNIKLFTVFLILLNFTIGVSCAEYSAPITVTNNPGQTGYQAKINLAYQTGMSADFANVRFFNDSTELSYWTQPESVVSSTNATFWIPINATTNLTCRWGISGETSSESNGEAVFPFIDTFSEATLNTSSKWTVDSGTPSVSDGICTLQYSGANVRMKTSTTFGTGYEAIFSSKITSSGLYTLFGFMNATSAWEPGAMWVSYESKYYTSINSSSKTSTPHTVSYNVYHTYKFSRVGSSSVVYSDNGSVTTVTTTVPTANLAFGVVSDTSSASPVYLDYIFIKKYAATEPTLTLGSVSQTPVADFSGTPTSGNFPLTVTFTDSSIDNPTSWAWNFGDGNTSTLQNPAHVYSVAGNYTVSLAATNSAGSDTEIKSNYISVSTPLGPTENITLNIVGENWGLISPGEQPSLNFSSDRAFSSISFSINGEPAGNLSGSWGAGVISVNGPVLNAGGRFFNVSLVAKTGGSESNRISYRISTTREQAENTPMEELDVSASDALQENLSSLNVTGSAAAIMSPFTSNLGRSAYIILFVLPFVFLWRQGEGMTLPSVLVMLVGSLLIGLIPESYWEVGIVAIVCAFAYSLWSLSHQK